MVEGIIDSAVLIDRLRSRAEAKAFITAASIGRRPQTHLQVAAELFAGARDKNEIRLIETFFRSFAIRVSTEADGLLTLDWYRQLRLSHGVDWPDCQIAATAIRLGLPVVTMNTKHFAACPGLQASRPY